MSSDDPYLHAPEIPPGCCKHGMPHKFGCDDCTIERLHAENATLTDRIDRLGETVQRLTAENEALREKLEDSEENVELLGLVAQGHVELLAEREADRAAMREIADVAHCGGLAGLSEGDALTLIRRLTLAHFDTSKPREHTAAAIEKLKARTA